MNKTLMIAATLALMNAVAVVAVILPSQARAEEACGYRSVCAQCNATSCWATLPPGCNWTTFQGCGTACGGGLTTTHCFDFNF